MKKLIFITHAVAAGVLAAGSAAVAEEPFPTSGYPTAATGSVPVPSLTAYFQDAAQTDEDDPYPELQGMEEPAIGSDVVAGEAELGYEYEVEEESALGEPWTLQSCLCGPCEPTHKFGGWVGPGIYTNNNPFSFEDNDLFAFWDNPGELNVDQLWFWVEKVADGDACSPDWGYRFDILYGVDAQKTQAFGNSGFPNPQGWDNDWDHGKYGWAIPQLYGEVDFGDLSVKAGHFFTLVGYEVIPKTGNFFYSHSFTMFNSEPFTHTGVLATYAASEDVTWYGGWTLGWDTGFDQFQDGYNFLGGFGVQLTEDIQYTYICTAGDLGWRGDGYSHSNVVLVTLSEDWEYVLQSDYLNTDREVFVGVEDESVGVVNYLFYTLNDCWKLGTRFEWWKSNLITTDMTSYYELTGGINYFASANLVFRPEVRYNFTSSDDKVDDVIGEEFDRVVFGIDAIWTF